MWKEFPKVFAGFHERTNKCRQGFNALELYLARNKQEACNMKLSEVGLELGFVSFHWTQTDVFVFFIAFSFCQMQFAALLVIDL